MISTLLAPPPDAPASLVALFEPWSRIYSDSKLIATIVVFAHVAPLLFAGGLAVTLDRATLRAAKNPDERPRQLEALAAAHRVVIAGLALSAVTGLLLFTADLDSYFTSWIFWTKMGLIFGLLVNGYRLKSTETRLRAGSDPVVDWSQLTQTAWASLVFWFLIAFFGVALVNAA